MNDQGNIGHRLDRANALKVQPSARLLLQMDVANRNGHRIHLGVTGKDLRLGWIGAVGLFPARITDKADLAFARHPRRMGHFRNGGGFIDVLGQRFA